MWASMKFLPVSLWMFRVLTNLIGSCLNLLCLESHLKMECRWTWPEVVILGADQKEHGLWGQECNFFHFSLSKNIIEITVTPNVAFSCVQLFQFTLAFLQNANYAYFPWLKIRFPDTKQGLHISLWLVQVFFKLHFIYLCNIETSKNSVVSIQHHFQTIHIFNVLLLLVKYGINQLMINKK